MHAFNVTTIPVGCSDDRYKQVADCACVLGVWQPMAYRLAWP